MGEICGSLWIVSPNGFGELAAARFLNQWIPIIEYNYPMNIPTLVTPRLCLRPWAIEDAGALHAILQEKDLLRYFPNTVPPSLERVQWYIDHQLQHWQERGCGHWAVAGQEAGALLGWVGLEYLPELDETEVAYLLSTRAWGKGLATEAAQAAVNFGFDRAGLARIIGLVHPENAASIRVLEKCGFARAKRIALWGMALEYYCR